MKKSLFASFALIATTLFAPLAHGQQFPKGTNVYYPPRNPAMAQKEQAAEPPQSLAARRQALAQVLAAIRQFRLETDPEYASSIGDKRYDADLTDYSAAAYEQWLARYNQFLLELAPIDTTGMSAAEAQSKDQMMQWLIAQEQRSTQKPWEEPIGPDSGLPFELPELPGLMQFNSALDYQNYLTRLHKVPRAFAQIANDMESGLEDGRHYSPQMLSAVLAQIRSIVTEDADQSPFAAPLHHFPASIPASEQDKLRKAVLAAIEQEVYPAYTRFGIFLEGLMPAPKTSKLAAPATTKHRP